MMKTLEEMMVEQCAPTLAGVKPANLFRCADHAALYKSVYEWNEKLQPHGVRIRILKRCRKTDACLIYVFRKDQLMRALEQQGTVDFLKENGYDMSGDMESVLCQLSRRLCMQKDFPHEIGLFLSYPPEDVKGFMDNHAANYKYSGIWKVYGDVNKAQSLFHR